MQAAEPASAVVIDGFVTSEHSQFWPFHHHPAIEPGSDLIVCFTDSGVRRSGTATEAQKRKRGRLEQQYGRPDPGGIEGCHPPARSRRRWAEAADGAERRASGVSRAIRQLPCEVTHLVTSSKERRDARKPAVPREPGGYAVAAQQRQSQAETIAWSKRRQASAERFAVFLVWRNYSEGPKGEGAGAVQRRPRCGGMRTDKLEIAVAGGRLFASRIALPGRWLEYYGRRVRTRVGAAAGA
ncbi:MAG: hypothetical protein IPH48_14050 [bacterium]|nr:hypothetical protein [bacterium]